MPKIMVVEDESIVAQDVQERLESLEYIVSVAPSGEKAVEKVEKENPDLVLMDIVLKGDMDGIEAAEYITSRFDIPVVFLTAYADDKTLKRAKVTEPFGYLVKPFEDRELHATIETALYKHTMEKRIRESEQWLSTTLQSISDAVITTDVTGVITFMNPAAEALTGWKHDNAVGMLLDEVFVTECSAVDTVLHHGALTVGDQVLQAKDGNSIFIEYSATPIKDKEVTGVVVAFRDITERKQMEKEKDRLLHHLDQRVKELSCLYGIDEIEKRENATIEDIFEEAVQLIPSSWQYPEVTGCCITAEGKLFKTMNFEKTPWMQKADIYVDSQKTGVIHVCYTEEKPLEDEGPFSKEERKLINAVAIRLGEFIERNQAEIQLKNVFEASKLINSTMDTSDVFRFISDSIQELVGFDNLAIFLVSEDRKSVYLAYAPQGVKELELEHAGDGLIGYCMETKTPVLSESILDSNSTETCSLVVPLIIEDQCIGALYIQQSEPNAYTKRDVAVLKPLSEVISSAVRNAKLHHEIKEFNEKLERKVEEKSKRTEVLLIAKQILQQEKSWERGLAAIAESAEKLGFERCGIFLVNTARKTLDFHHGIGAGLPDAGTSISLDDPDYFGVKCVQETQRIFVKDAATAEGKQITEAHSFVWVPIVVQNEAFAAIAAGNISKKMITDEDVKDLEILAGMCAAFIDRTRMLREPVPENRLKTEVSHWLNPAACYIVTEKKPEKSFEIFVDLVTHGVPGFAVSRMNPEKLKRRLNLVKTPVLWLSRYEMENTISPEDLPKLQYIIEDFTRKSGESIILFDGVEYLVTQRGFETVLKYLQDLEDMIVRNNSRLVIPLHKDTVSVKEYSILEREFEIL